MDYDLVFSKKGKEIFSEKGNLSLKELVKKIDSMIVKEK